MKRIVRMVNLYPPYIVGGNEMLTRDIVEALRDRGYELHVLTAHGRELDGIPYVHQVFNYDLDKKDEIFRGTRPLSPIELFRHHVFDAATYRDVQRTVRQLQPDLVVADNLYMSSAAPLLAVRDLPCPVVAQVADKWLLFNLVDWGLVVNPSKPHHRWLVDLVRRVVQKPIRGRVRLDGIATVSNFVRSFYVDAGFPSEKLETTYLGVHTDTFYPGPPHALHDPVRLIFIGGLWEGKGPQIIVKALRILSDRQDLPRFQLDIFGEGTEQFLAYLDGVIREEGVEQQVHFHGFVPWERLVDAMHQSDIFVFSSFWDEPFAITPLQAMACGLPVVAARAGGTEEGYTDGETALLIPPRDERAMADAIAQLVLNGDLRGRMRENGIRDIQEKWTFEAYVDRLLDFYGRVTDRYQ